MAIEISVYTNCDPITYHDLAEACEKHGVAVRYLDFFGQPTLEPDFKLSPISKEVTVIAWTSKDKQTTKSVDKAITQRNKPALDVLGVTGKVAWFTLSSRNFNYISFWKSMTTERRDYECALDADTLSSVRSATCVYKMRCGTRPPHCARFMDEISGILSSICGGVVLSPN
jgi:hypothetical protein